MSVSRDGGPDAEHPMDALTLLSADHRRVRGMLAELDATDDEGPARHTLVARIKDELAVHETMEEQIVYAALESDPRALPSIRDGFAGHDRVDALVDRLAAMPPADARWSATAAAMRDGVERHVEAEERALFDEARRILSDVELDRLGRTMAERRLTIERQMSSETR